MASSATNVSEGASGASGSEALAASRSLGEAIRAGEARKLEGLLDGEFTYIDRSGAVQLRQQALSSMSAEAGAGQADASVIDYGEVALITWRQPSDLQSELVAVEAWVKRAEGWRALVRHLNVIAGSQAPSAHPAHTPRPPDAAPPRCENPCEFVPYEPRSQDERDIIASFQTLENAVIRNDAAEWVRHMADEFVVYRTRQHPTTKAERAEALLRQKAVNAEIFVAAVEAMQLWVFGNAAIMRADHVMPGNRRPPYRATRVWVKRDGRWRMAVSQQTTRQ